MNVADIHAKLLHTLQNLCSVCNRQVLPHTPGLLQAPVISPHEDHLFRSSIRNYFVYTQIYSQKGKEKERERERKRGALFKNYLCSNQVCCTGRYEVQMPNVFVLPQIISLLFVAGYNIYHHHRVCLFWLQKTSSHSCKRVS